MFVSRAIAVYITIVIYYCSNYSLYYYNYIFIYI